MREIGLATIPDNKKTTSNKKKKKKTLRVVTTTTSAPPRTRRQTSLRNVTKTSQLSSTSPDTLDSSAASSRNVTNTSQSSSNPETLDLSATSLRHVTNTSQSSSNPETLDSSEDNENPVKRAVPITKKGKKGLDSTLMKKNANGRVEISRLAFHASKKLTQERLNHLLGLDYLRLSEGKKEQMSKWYHTMKKACSAFCRSRIAEEVCNNCDRLEYDYGSVEELMVAWEEAESKESQEELATIFEKVLYEGYFAKRVGPGKKQWKYHLEKEVMDEFGLAYDPNDSEETKKLDGCLALLGTRCHCDLVKRIQSLGKREHGQLFSRKAADGKKRPAGTSKDSIPIEMISSFIRPVDRRPATGKKIKDDSGKVAAKTKKAGRKEGSGSLAS